MSQRQNEGVEVKQLVLKSCQICNVNGKMKKFNTIIAKTVIKQKVTTMNQEASA